MEEEDVDISGDIDAFIQEYETGKMAVAYDEAIAREKRIFDREMKECSDTTSVYWRDINRY